MAILNRSFTQKVEVIEVLSVENNVFDAYRMSFQLSPSSFVICTLDFGTDGELRIYDIEGRQTPESLAIFSQFVSNKQWLKESIELETRYRF